MLGGNHFKRKLAKKERKQEAKKASAATAPRSGAPPALKVPSQPAAASTSQQRPKTRNNSTLKGPVVSYPSEVRAVRDGGNDRSGVKFQNTKEEAAYMWKHKLRESPAAKAGQQAGGRVDGTQAHRTASADSGAQRRALRKTKNSDDLLDSFRTKLSASTFRLLNEQIYSSPNAFAGQLLRDTATFEDYHKGYRQQLVQWPMNPNKIIIDALLGDKRGRFLANKAKSMPGYIPTSWVICDMGCGDAHIAAALKPKHYTVHSFDFCAVNEHVVVADSSKVPLESASVDICVFSLSLMATDYFDNLLEAYRVLKPKRLLKIVEVRSRVPNPNLFAELVEGIGFTCDWYDVAGDYFIAFDFLKNDGESGANTQPVHHPGDVLLPSLYKKR